jgi:hypothetical protein
MRRLVALCVSLLVACALVTALGGPAGAASSAVGTDPTGDNPPAKNAKGDITAYSIVYEDDGDISANIAVRTFDNPATSPAWVDWLTGPLYGFDTNGDDLLDYAALMLNDGGGSVFASLLDSEFNLVCDATPSWVASAKRYTITFPSSCIGSPPSVRLTAAFEYDTSETSSWDETGFTAAVVRPAPPDAPTNVTATAGNAQATVSWLAPFSNGSPIVGYTVTATPGGAEKFVAANVTATTITGLTNGVAYTFTVTAENGMGMGDPSVPSNPVTPAPQVPSTPGNVHAAIGDQSVLVMWSPSADNGSPISKYTIHVSPGGAIDVPAPALFFTVSGLTNGTHYTFTVDATNGVGTSAASALVGATPAAVPGAPTNVHAAAGKGVATVGWTAPPNNGSAISKYTVTASPGGAHVSVGGSATSASINLPIGHYTFTVTATNAAGVGPASDPSPEVFIAQNAARAGYWMLGRDGNVYAFGNAVNYGRATFPAGVVAVAIATNANGTGYWVVGNDGSVRAFGAATSHGERPALPPGEFVSTISPTLSGNGYWLFTNRGRAVRYGDAQFYGDMSGTPLNGPVIASVATPTGHGYYMVGSDGGVFTFGDARFRGSMGGVHLNRPVVGLAPTPDNHGYWLVASDGGVFAFNAPFRGSMGSTRLNRPVNGLVAFGNGYLMVASDGGVFNFSNKTFFGSLGSHPPASPVIGISAFAV